MRFPYGLSDLDRCIPHLVKRKRSIRGFLALLEKDLASSRHITTLPDDLARAMLARLGKPVDLTEDIQGDVVL